TRSVRYFNHENMRRTGSEPFTSFGAAGSLKAYPLPIPPWRRSDVFVPLSRSRMHRVDCRAVWFASTRRSRAGEEREGREEDLRVQGSEEGDGVLALCADQLRQGEEVAAHHRAARTRRQPAAVHRHSRAD